MTVRIDPPFKVVQRISAGADPDMVSLKRLRDVVAGRDATFSRAHAMALLLNSDFPNKHRDFEAVLENEEDSSEIRYLAAIHLGKINTPAALEILLKNVQTRDERVLAGIVKMMGRIGGKPALDVLSRVEKYTTGFAASQTRFAAALISYRLGLEGNDLPIPDNGDYLTLPRGAARPFQFLRADKTDAEFCLRALADQPFGVEFSEQPMYQIRCGRRTWMILFNRDSTGQDAVQTLEERKAFPAVIASRSEESGLYSIAFLLLTSPARQQGMLNTLIVRPNGDLIFAGTTRVEANLAAFSIHAVSRPGAFAIELDGTFEDGRLEMKHALSTVLVQVEKRQPIQGRRPESVPQ